MIKVERTAKPVVLVKKQQAWTHALLTAVTKADRQRAEGKYRHAAIRNALNEMFFGKCAYCESKITHVAYGHIEHFHPKSKPEFRALTFEWTNMVLACPLCNGAEYKGDKFPTAEEGGPLVNPCEDSPADHFEFFIDRIARLATVVGKTERGKTTDRILGLNRPDLRAYRSKLVMQLCVLSSLEQTDSDAKALIQAACQNDAEYAAFARQLPITAVP